MAVESACRRHVFPNVHRGFRVQALGNGGFHLLHRVGSGVDGFLKADVVARHGDDRAANLGHFDLAGTHGGRSRGPLPAAILFHAVAALDLPGQLLRQHLRLLGVV